MTTAAQLITRALGIINQTDPDEAPTAKEIEDGLDYLNMMLDSWRLERLMVYQVRQESFSWPANIQSRTIGSGGDLNTERPVAIQAAYLHTNDTGLDYPLRVLARREEYDGIINKAVGTTIPQYLFMDAAYPLGRVYLWCVPTVDVTVKLDTWTPLPAFANATDDVILPPGYQRAIVHNLAIEMAPEFGAQVSPATLNAARTAKAAIKTVNAPAMVASLDNGVQGLAGLPKGRRYNIFADN